MGVCELSVCAECADLLHLRSDQLLQIVIVDHLYEAYWASVCYWAGCWAEGSRVRRVPSNVGAHALGAVWAGL